MEFKNIKNLIYFGTILLCFLIVYFLIKPSILSVKDTQKELLRAQKILEQKEKALLKFKKVSGEYKKQRKNIQKMDKILLLEPDLPLILLQFWTLAGKSEVVLEDISFGALEKSEKGVGSLPASLVIKGRYSAFKDFLEAVAKNLNLMEVENITFKVKREEEKEEEEKIYSFSLDINILTQALPKVEEKPPVEEEEIMLPEK